MSAEALTCAHVAAKAGISRDAAWKRLRRYFAGEITREALLAPKQVGGVGRRRGPDDDVVEAIMEVAGLTRASARKRLRLAEAGDMPRDLLYASGKEILAWRVAQRRAEDRRVARQAPTKTGNWGDLGLGPRKSPHEIKGGTAWERRNLGPR